MLADAVRVGVRHIPGAVAALRIVAADIEQEGVFVLHLPDNAERLLGRGSGRSHCAQVDGIDGQRRRPWAGLTTFDHRVHAPVVETWRQPAVVVIVGKRRDGVDDRLVEGGFMRQLETVAGGMGNHTPADDHVGSIDTVAVGRPAEGGQRHRVGMPRRQLAGAIDGPGVGGTGIAASRFVGQQV